MKIKTNTPKRLPLKKLDWEALTPFLGQAHRVIEHFEDILQTTAIPSTVLYLLTIDESISSVHTVKGTLKKVLSPEIFAKNPKKIAQILNYKKALTYACKQKRMTSQVLCKIHALCQKNSMRHRADLGRFRKRQNWIGPEGCPMEKGLFFPPKASLVPKYMKNLQAYLSYREKDPLVQLAIYFAQFLCIHPFMDGNGRVGRIALPVFLWQKKLTSYPLFFLSGYFTRHYDTYFEKLFHIYEKQCWEGWIIFFLKAVIEEGERTCRKAKKLIELYNKWASKLSSFSPITVQKSLEFFFKNPIFSQGKFSDQTQIPLATQEKIFKILKILEFKGVKVCEPILSAL